MDPVLLTFRAPHHPLDRVGAHVVREELPSRLQAWRQNSRAQACVYLATCQRALWMLWRGRPEGLGLGPDAQRLEGEAAWTHLLRLASGLESATLGDLDVLKQLRDALEAARRAGTAGPEAVEALEDILREARRLRARLGLGEGHASVASVALEHLEGKLPKGARVALVGVGPMTRYLAERLPGRGFEVAVANRTHARAEALAAELGTACVPLERLRRSPCGFRALVSATASPEPLFTLEGWRAASHEGLLALDLALPPDLEPALGALPWLQLLDLRSLLEETDAAKVRRAEAARRAEAWLPEAVARLRARAAERDRKRAEGEARGRVNAAFARLHARAGDEDPVRELLARGRTLAHRALAQGDSPEAQLGRVADILQLEET